jgi:hypothetical protein
MADFTPYKKKRNQYKVERSKRNHRLTKPFFHIKIRLSKNKTSIVEGKREKKNNTSPLVVTCGMLG